MKKYTSAITLFLISFIFIGGNCKKSSDPAPVPPAGSLYITAVQLNNSTVSNGSIVYDMPVNASAKFHFNTTVSRASTAGAFSLQNGNTSIPVSISYQDNDSTVVIMPSSALSYLNKYTVSLNTTLLSSANKNLGSGYTFSFITGVDPSDKFPVISDSALLDLVESQTFKYFWDFGHPVSGLARERSNSTPETVTSGGSGFGIMAIPVAVKRNFITRAQALARMQTIVGFLKNTAQTFHGAFPHWLNGSTGAVIPFSPKDDGADLVETSYLMAGLLTARQFFDQSTTAETNLRADINTLWNNVQWNWFRKNNENVLYWHWSNTYAWDMNHRIEGWNECLITYIMAASSTTYSVPQAVYTQGFARNGAEVNGNTYYGYQLPLGPAYGGPLFWSHYSFLGVNPMGLTDQFANYQTQVVNHTKINYEYCKANPHNYFGYSAQCWGLTASDIPNGYSANEPTNDIGVISPTAALSSMPYTPTESMAALKYFYYKLGDKIWSNYGFVDAFSLKDLWYANSHLAIDQGPIIVMIENYRSKQIWNLLMSCPEIKNGMRNVMGFTSPNL